MADEEEIYAALAALMDEVVWVRPGSTTEHRFKVTTRRIILFNEAATQPWCGQAEYGEEVNQITGMPYKSVLEAHWLIYQNLAKNKKAEATIENNLIVAAVKKALAPKPSDRGFDDKRNTLGGLVHHCYIQGRIFKDPGDIDGQGLILVPFKILVP